MCSVGHFLQCFFNKMRKKKKGIVPAGVPSVWSVLGPVEDEGVPLPFTVQSNLSSLACVHFPRPVSNVVGPLHAK